MNAYSKHTDAYNNHKVHYTWLMLKITYALLFLAIGLDKCFLGWQIVDWSKYLSPLIPKLMPFLTVHQHIFAGGIVELILAGVIWFYPRIGGYAAAGLLGAIIINLLTMNMFYDIMARDVVIAIGAIALSRLTEAQE